MKTIIVGGAGFIGTNLTKKLLSEANEEREIICIDDLSTGRESNITQFYDNPNFHFLKLDLLGDYLETFLKPFEKNDVDQIYHLASPASPPKYQIDPIKTFRVNTEGTLKLLDLAKRNNAKILFASTSEIYGDPLEHPQKETYRGNVNINGPRACYDEGKRGGETLCWHHHQKYGTKVLIARIFNTYGPYMDPADGRVVSNMICQLLRGEDVTVYGDGTQTRSFMYVDDLVDGLIKLMDSELYASPVNLGNPVEFSIKQLATLLLSEFHWPNEPKIIKKELPQDDPKQRKPDIEKAKTLLNWEPKVDLFEGLAKTIPYFKEELNK